MKDRPGVPLVLCAPHSPLDKLIPLLLAVTYNFSLRGLSVKLVRRRVSRLVWERDLCTWSYLHPDDKVVLVLLWDILEN